MTDRRGLLMINTGPGKGKTTASLGAALRAAGAGLKVLVIQFIKGKWRYGELEALAGLANISIRPMGLGLMGKDADLTPHREKAAQAMATAKDEMQSGRWELLILDELCYALERGLIGLDDAMELIKQRPPALHMILTGRGCPKELIEAADTVTYFQDIKHHLAAGVQAQTGIEF
jgi:cob(I)alamin adenosyltransferase